MKWVGRRGSGNIEDRRGSGVGLPVKGGIGVLVIAFVVWILGGNPLSVLNFSGGSSPVEEAYQPSAGEDTLVQFVSVVLADTEEVWTDIFRQMGRTYRKPTLVMYTGQVNSACGFATKATGPFYCPEDEKIYLDLSFFDEMRSQLGAGGDFAYAYVIAHEVGHHVQKLLGTMERVDALRNASDEKENNALSVQLELQADFYAGVWAHHAQQMFDSLDDNDIDEALNAANAIGDDRLQQQAQGYVVPDSFTHGTSAQRKEAFYKGYQGGVLSDG